MKTRKYLILIFAFVMISLSYAPSSMKAEAGQSSIVHVSAGVWLVNIEKVDLAANSYTLDFYLWFRFNSSQISLADVKNFEFMNGKADLGLIKEDATEGYLEYRVKGTFIKTFDFSKYPFETHLLAVELEHKSMNAHSLIYDSLIDESGIDENINVAGWNVENFEIHTFEHFYQDEPYSRIVFSVSLSRPALSSFIKSVLPIMVITTISLLAFFISPQNFSQRIGLGVTTLLSATAFHLSLLSGLPPTGYLTMADRIMLAIYVIFLYNLSASVYVMKLVDAKKNEEAVNFNKKALKILPILIIILAALQLVF